MEAAEFRFEAGDAVGARALAQELRSAAPPGPERARISYLLSNFSWNDVNEIRGLLESVIAETSEEDVLADVHADLAYVEILGGHLRSGSEHGRRAIELAERADAPAPLMDALLSTAEAEFMLGLDAAALLSRAASIEGRIVGRPPFWSLLASVGNALGAQLMWSGDLVGGRRTLERTYRDLVDRGHYTILWETLPSSPSSKAGPAPSGPRSSTPRSSSRSPSRRATTRCGTWACGPERWPKHTSGSSSLLGAMRPRDSRSPSNTATCST